MLALLALVHAGAFLRHGRGKGDPVCATGIVSTAQDACCPQSCGACDEGADACRDGPGTDGCCPEHVKSEARSCDETHPPCVLSASYGQANANVLRKLQRGGRHAKDDCNEVIKKTADEAKLNTNFVAKAGYTSGNADTKSCGSMTALTLADAAVKCLADEACVGFSSNDAKLHAGRPDCLFTKFGTEQTSTSSTLYIKVKNQAGALQPRGLYEFYHPEGTTANGQHALHKIVHGHPAEEAAEALSEETSDETARVLGSANPEGAAGVLAVMPEEDAANAIVNIEQDLGPGPVAQIVQDLPENVGAGIMEEIPLTDLEAIIDEAPEAIGLDLLGELPGELQIEVIHDTDTGDLADMLMIGPPEDGARILENIGGRDGPEAEIDLLSIIDPPQLIPILEEMIDDTSEEDVADLVDELPREIQEPIQQNLQLDPCFEFGFQSPPGNDWSKGGKGDAWFKELKKKGWAKCEINQLSKKGGEWKYDGVKTCVCEGVASSKCKSGTKASGSGGKAGSLEDQVKALTKAKNRGPLC